jgi:hypothetical protein
MESEAVRKYAEEQRIPEEDALKNGMGKVEGVRDERSAEVYAKA